MFFFFPSKKHQTQKFKLALLNLVSGYYGCSIKHLNNKLHPSRTQYRKQFIADSAYLLERHV